MTTGSGNRPALSGPPAPFSPNGIQDAPVTAGQPGATAHQRLPTGPDRPPGRRTAWRVAAAATTALLSIGAASSFASPMVQQRETRTSALSPSTRLLVLHNPTGTVHVRAANAHEEPQVRVTYSSAFAQVPVQVTQHDGRAEVSASCAGPFSGCAADWTVVVPADVDLETHLGAGDLTVSRMTGELRLEQGTGDLQLRGIASREVSVRAGAGDISIETAGPVHRLFAQAGTGDITVAVPEDATRYDVTANAGAGRTSVDIPDADGAANRIEVQAGLGDIEVQHD